MDFIYNSNIDAICSNYLEARYSRSINFFYITFMIASFMKMDLDEVTMSKFDDHRRGYSVSKRLVKLTRFKRFSLQLSGHQDIPPLSFVLRHQL